MRGWGGGGGCGVSANENSCTHGAQINFGDLNPYLTYDCQSSNNNSFRFRLSRNLLYWKFIFKKLTSLPWMKMFIILTAPSTLVSFHLFNSILRSTVGYIIKSGFPKHRLPNLILNCTSFMQHNIIHITLKCNRHFSKSRILNLNFSKDTKRVLTK